MSTSAVNANIATLAGSGHAPRKAVVHSAESSPPSFSAVLSAQTNGTPFSDADIKSFFANNPSHAEMASKAATLGLNRNQIVSALHVAGYGGQTIPELNSDVDRFVATASNGYSWGANGKLVATDDRIGGYSGTVDLSKSSIGEVADQLKSWAAQGMEMAEMARRAEAGGVGQETLNTLSATNQGAGRLAIDNAYANYSLQQTMVAGVAQDSGRFVRLGAPKSSSLTDAQQLWNAQHSGMYTDNAATGGNFNWTDLGGWQQSKTA